MRVLRRTPLRALVLGGTCARHDGRRRLHRSRRGCGPERSSSRLDHALQRPARADGLEARGGLREAHRRTRRGALRRRGHAREPDHPGGLQVARRRVLRREPAGAAGARRAQAAGAGARRHAEGRSARRQLAARDPGSRVSARSAVLVYNTGKIKPAALPSSLLDLAKPKWKGKVAIAAGRDRLPAARHLDRAPARQGGRRRRG